MYLPHPSEIHVMYTDVLCTGREVWLHDANTKTSFRAYGVFVSKRSCTPDTNNYTVLLTIWNLKKNILKIVLVLLICQGHVKLQLLKPPLKLPETNPRSQNGYRHLADR